MMTVTIAINVNVDDDCGGLKSTVKVKSLPKDEFAKDCGGKKVK